MDFSGRRVVVAGGAGNIGMAVVQELLNRGAKVIVTTRTKDRFEALKKTIPVDRQSSISAVVADVTTEEGAAAIFDHSTNQPGGVQHVIASVGSLELGGKLVDHTLEEFNKNLKDRVTSHFLLFKAFCAYLEKQQGSTYTMLTGGGGYVMPGISLVCVATGALHGLSSAARAELKDNASGLAFCDFRIHCTVLPQPDSEVPTSDPHSMGHDLVAKAILATMASKTHDVKDIYNRRDAQLLAHSP